MKQNFADISIRSTLLQAFTFITSNSQHTETSSLKANMLCRCKLAAFRLYNLLHSKQVPSTKCTMYSVCCILRGYQSPEEDSGEAGKYCFPLQSNGTAAADIASCPQHHHAYQHVGQIIKCQILVEVSGLNESLPESWITHPA